jgi:hypothetical protein
MEGKELKLLDIELYSHCSPHYVTEKELKLQEKTCPETVTQEERLRYELVKKQMTQKTLHHKPCLEKR